MSVVSDYTALLSGQSWGGEDVSGRPAFVTFSFETAPASYLSERYSTSFLGSFQPLSAAEQAIARDALVQWANASGLVLFEVPAGQGDIRFGQYEFELGPEDVRDFAGYALYPDVYVRETFGSIWQPGGDIFIDIGEADFRLLSHEIGHALGLKHPFEDDGGLPTLDPAIDDAAHTVMTYTPSAAPFTTLGSLDLEAIRHLYGTQAQDGAQVASWSWNATSFILTQGGSAGADTIIGVGVRDVMTGGAGADHLIGGAGSDQLDGGADDDVLDGGYGADTLVGGDGNDILNDDDDEHSASGLDRLVGGAGDDDLWVTAGTVNADGGAGDDALLVVRYDAEGFKFSFADLLANGGSVTNIETIYFFGDIGGDTLVGGALADGLQGDAGADSLSAGDGGDSLWGDDGSDTLSGGEGDDYLEGGTGDDLLAAGSGADYLDGGAGIDTADFGAELETLTLTLNASRQTSGGEEEMFGIENVIGTPYGDAITGDPGANQLYGRLGNDTIAGGNGANYLRGDEGNDSLTGGADFDDINGNMGDDTAAGGDGDDWVVGGKDNDRLFGDAGGDIVYGNIGNDTLDGGVGVDLVRGGQGDDVVSGAAGNDWLSGDRGDDTLSGGGGADTFHSFSGAGIDRVTDFSAADGDRIQLDAGTTYTLRQAGADAVIDMANGDQVILVGVSMSSLTASTIFLL